MITQGVIVLAVVIAYEVVRRYRRRGSSSARSPRELAASRHARPEEVPGMSVPAPGPPRRSSSTPRARQAPRARAAVVLLAVIAGLIAAARAWSAWSPAPTTSTSSRHPRRTLIGAMPIGLAGLGGLWSERAGVVNIGLEGMMILGTWGRLLRLPLRRRGPVSLGAILLGLLGGLLHALATVIFGVDHIVSGVAINIIAPGRGAVPRRR